MDLAHKYKINICSKTKKRFWLTKLEKFNEMDIIMEDVTSISLISNIVSRN